MESTFKRRVWHTGPPPHVGWWNASTWDTHFLWRWWDGKCWSDAANERFSDEKQAAMAAQRKERQWQSLRWNDWYPPDAAVPRIDPEKYVWLD